MAGHKVEADEQDHVFPVLLMLTVQETGQTLSIKIH